MLDKFKIRFLNMKNKLRKKIDFIYNFYKKSIIDIRQFLIYIIKKALKFHLILLVLAAFCVIINIYFPSAAPNFNGVLISILAAVIFEGYRSYRKYTENLIVFESCLNDIKNLFEKFFNDFEIESNNSLIHLHLTAKVKDFPIARNSLIENLNISLNIISEVEKKNIKLNKEKNADNDDFEDCIKVYSAFKTSANKILISDLDRIINIIVTYSVDSIFIKNMYILRENLLEIVNNDIWPDAFYDGQPATVCFSYIKNVISSMILILDYINNENKND